MIAPCARCAEFATQANPRPVWRCPVPGCGVVSITEMCVIKEGRKVGFRAAMQAEFGSNFKYRITHPV